METTSVTMPIAVADEVYNAVDSVWTAPGHARRRKPADEWVEYARRIQAREGSARVVVLAYEAAMARYA